MSRSESSDDNLGSSADAALGPQQVRFSVVAQKTRQRLTKYDKMWDLSLRMRRHTFAIERQFAYDLNNLSGVGGHMHLFIY